MGNMCPGGSDVLLDYSPLTLNFASRDNPSPQENCSKQANEVSGLPECNHPKRESNRHT